MAFVHAILAVLAISSFTKLAAAQDGIPYCPDVYGVQTHEHPEHCDKFYLCENGTLTLETCENGLLFSGKGGAAHNHCNYNWQVDCGKRLHDDTAISTPGCLYQFGIYPKTPGGCHTSFVKCAYGVPYETPCEAGLAYDERNHSCNWPDLLTEICDPEQVVGFRCPDKVTPDQLAYKFWPYPRFTIPGDSHRLVTCVNGYPRLITCEPGKLVNEKSLTCEEVDYKK